MKTPVIFLKADEDVDTETRGFEAGVSDFIRKPFNPDVLLRRIDNNMSNSQEMHEIKSAAAVELAKMCSEKTGCLMMSDLDFLARAGQVGNGMANLVKSLMGRPLLVLRNGKMGVGMTYISSRLHLPFRLTAVPERSVCSISRNTDTAIWRLK